MDFVFLYFFWITRILHNYIIIYTVYIYMPCKVGSREGVIRLQAVDIGAELFEPILVLSAAWKIGPAAGAG